MAITNKLKTLCENLGKNNKATYTVVAIALAKGICRPIFTMMDKKESPQTKKYAALREGLTEAIAIPTYIALGEIAAKGGKYFAKGDPAKLPIAQSNLRFLGVCFAALVAIPGICSIVVKPFTNKIMGKPEDSNPPKTESPKIQETISVKPAGEKRVNFGNYYKNSLANMHRVNLYSANNGGMKIC